MLRAVQNLVAHDMQHERGSVVDPTLGNELANYAMVQIERFSLRRRQRANLITATG